jgi:hypothetical protein
MRFVDPALSRQWRQPTLLLRERDLVRHWRQPTVPYAAFVAVCLIKLNEARVSMADLQAFLVDHPSLPWLAGFPRVPDPQQAGLPHTACCHMFWATGTTTYLPKVLFRGQNGGTIEYAQQPPARSAARPGRTGQVSRTSL